MSQRGPVSPRSPVSRRGLVSQRGRAPRQVHRPRRGAGVPEGPGGRPRFETAFGAIAGLLTAAVALGVGQLVSGLGARQGSPAAAVGEAAIDLAPPPVKDFAISAFGSNDKTALVIGILVLLAVFAAVIGVAAMRRLSYGYAGLVIFAAIGMAAALTRPGRHLRLRRAHDRRGCGRGVHS